jgi:3D (Asp-Asp-Asp) domain-containing protein
MEGNRMLNKLKTFIAFAVLSGTVSANVQAETVTEPTGNTFWELQSVNNISLEDSPAPAKAEADSKHDQAPTPEPHALKPEAQALKEREPVKAEAEVKPQKSKGSKQITVKATAYTASCEGCSGITKTGINIKANPDAKVIAVDPSVIPLGSKVYVEGFGKATAADIGGGIEGKEIDIFIPSEQDAIEFGVQKLKVTILN